MSTSRRNSAKNHRSHQRILVIYNPIAGRRRQIFFRKTLKKLAKRGLDIQLEATTARGDAERLAQEATAHEADRPDLIVAAGGDGTINEVVNGLKGADIPLGIIPMGTANVLAKEIGLKQRSWQVAQVLAERVVRPVHIGEVQRPDRSGARRFLMMAGAGYDAGVVARVNVQLKYRWGKVAYGIAGMMEWLRGNRQMLTVDVDGQVYQSAWVVIAKGRYYGGGFSIARKAKLTDDNLVACILPGTRRIDLARYLMAILFARIEKQPDVRIIPAHQIAISDARDIQVEVDGDLYGSLPIRFSVAPETLPLVQPA